MKKRNLGIMVLLTVVTFGIYVLVWLYKSRKEITNTLGNPQAIPPFFYLLAPVLLVTVAFLVSFLAGYNNHGGGTNNIAVNLVVILAGFVGIIGVIAVPFWWFYKYFQAEHMLTCYTDNVLLYVIWILCAFLVPLPIWMLLTQIDINKFLAFGPGPAPIVGQPQAPVQQ
jgi:hypothetical protein